RSPLCGTIDAAPGVQRPCNAKDGGGAALGPRRRQQQRYLRRRSAHYARTMDGRSPWRQTPLWSGRVHHCTAVDLHFLNDAASTARSMMTGALERPKGRLSMLSGLGQTSITIG